MISVTTYSDANSRFYRELDELIHQYSTHKGKGEEGFLTPKQLEQVYQRISGKIGSDYAKKDPYFLLEKSIDGRTILTDSILLPFQNDRTDITEYASGKKDVGIKYPSPERTAISLFSVFANFAHNSFVKKILIEDAYNNIFLLRNGDNLSPALAAVQTGNKNLIGTVFDSTKRCSTEVFTQAIIGIEDIEINRALQIFINNRIDFRATHRH